MVTKLTIKFYFEFLVASGPWLGIADLSSVERLMVMLPNTVTQLPDSYLCVP